MTEQPQPGKPFSRRRWPGLVLLLLAGLAASRAWHARHSQRVPAGELTLDRYVLSLDRPGDAALHVHGKARAQRWTLTVLDAAQQPVVELASGTADTPVEAVWKGQDGRGKVVPDGTYLLRLTGRDRWGWRLSASEQRVIVDRQPPQVGWRKPPAPRSLATSATVAEVFEVQIEMWEANPSEVQLDYRAEGKGTSWQPVPEVLATKRTNPDGSRRYTYRVAASRLNLGGQDRFRLRATALDQAGHRTTLERAFRLASGPTLAVGFAPDTGQRAGRDQCRVAVWWTAPAARPVLELRLFAVDLQTQKRRLLATHRPPGNKPTGTFETTVSRPLPTARFLVIASDRAGQFAQAMWSGY